jgi:hypothetical protein
MEELHRSFRYGITRRRRRRAKIGACGANFARASALQTVRPMQELDSARASRLFRFADKRFELDIAGFPAVFIRNWYTGRAVLAVDGRVIEVRPWIPVSSPFVLVGPQHESWQGMLGDRRLQVEYERRVLFSEFRRTTYRVLVDGSVVWERRLLW